jgi:hypothetical protein
MVVHQEQGFALANLPIGARWFPQGDAAKLATNRVARVNALLGMPMEGFLLPGMRAAAHSSHLMKDWRRRPRVGSRNGSERQPMDKGQIDRLVIQGDDATYWRVQIRAGAEILHHRNEVAACLLIQQKGDHTMAIGAVVKVGSQFHIYTETGAYNHHIPANSGDTLIGYTSTSFAIRRGLQVFIHSESGRLLGSFFSSNPTSPTQTHPTQTYNVNTNAKV